MSPPNESSNLGVVLGTPIHLANQGDHWLLPAFPPLNTEMATPLLSTKRCLLPPLTVISLASKTTVYHRLHALPSISFHAVVPLPALGPAPLGPALGLLPEGDLGRLHRLPSALRCRGGFTHILELSKGSSFHACVQLTHPTPTLLIYCLFT